MTEKILLTPGPINVSFNVKKKTLIDYGSRDTEFMQTLKMIKSKLFGIFKISDSNQLVLLQGSGTYGVESVLTGLTEKIVVLVNGAYGQRMRKILDYSKCEYSFLTFEEGTEIDYEVVDKYLSEHSEIKYVAFVHLETSTGILNNLERMKSIALKHNKKLVVDAIASFGSDIFDFNNIDFVITSSNKCLQGLPGFCLVISTNLSEIKSKSYVLDILDQNKNFESSGQFRFTPPTHTLVAFFRALEELELETLEKRAQRFKNIKTYIYNMCEKLNIKPFVDGQKYATGNICHTFLSPNHQNFNFKKLYDTLAKYGFLIYPGKLTNVESFRIGSIGHLTEFDIAGFCEYFTLIFNKMLEGVEAKVSEIDTTEFYKYLEQREINFFSGVPDSLLQDLNNCILDRSKDHFVMPNEGLAVSIASGYYTSTQKIPCVYLQNSGIGNIINPLMSLTHNNVYSIPMLIIIGWRGEPNVHDEPQHISQGECMVNLIQSMNFEKVYLDKLNWRICVDKCIDLIHKTRQPVFLIVRKGTFSKYKLSELNNGYSLIRRDVIKKLVVASTANDLLCCTTGKSSRELDEEAGLNNVDKSRLFLMVGSMGHLSSYCLGLSLYHKNKKVWCIDGDGAMLMHFGSMPMIGHTRPKNFIHILLNNSMHESVGIQPTIAQDIDFSAVAKQLGYKNIFTIKNNEELDQFLKTINSLDDLTFAHILLSNKQSLSDNLSRPKTTPLERLNSLIEYIKK
jgi:phosphonopyruvate decarboxylase